MTTCSICEMPIDKDTKIELYGKGKVKKKVHLDCFVARTQEDNDKDECYRYVHDIIMGYAKHFKSSDFIYLRLKGLHDGKFYANNNVPSQGSYTYKEILYTFKAKSLEIARVFKEKNFDNDQKKFNYAVKIVENNINEIATRMKKAEEANAKNESFTIENLKIEEPEIKQPVIKEENTNKAKKILENLW